MKTDFWRKKIGFWRSLIMYYWKPFNQRRLQHFYREFIREGDLCFDIGAHLGNRVAAWQKLGATIIALDPQPLCVNYLQKRFGNYPQIQIIAKAVGAQPGKTTMYVSQRTPTVSTLADQTWREQLSERSNRPVKWEEQIEVEMLTLDQLITTYGIPVFCKIDVEDYEAEVLKGLSTPIRGISFEFFNWTPERTKECLQLLNNLGNYEYNWSVGESQRFQTKYWSNSEKMLLQIQQYRSNTSFSGDIYARLKTL